MKDRYKLIVWIFAIFALVSCATPQQAKKATEPASISTGKSKAEVIAIVVDVVVNEGFSIDNINEKYGLVTCKPMQILTGELMTKVGEPGGGWISTNGKMYHSIEFSAMVNSNGILKIKIAAYDEKAPENLAGMIGQTNMKTTRSFDTFRTLKLQKYYLNQIKGRL